MANKEAIPTETTKPAPAAPAKRNAGRKVGAKGLTPSQKAECVALWRSGSSTLDDLSKKYGKRPETFSRMFKRMGIEKGSAVLEAAKQMEAAAAANALASVDVELQRLNQAREEHWKYSRGLAQLVWAEIIRARTAGIDLGSLKDVMATLKAAGDVIANSRKELFSVLRAEERAAETELDELPELTVRELTQLEIDSMQGASREDEMGGDMPDLVDDEVEDPQGGL